MLCAAGYPYGNDAYHSIVLIDGDEISETDALTYRPTEGEYITASIVPHGGKTGKTILAVLLGILMIISGFGMIGLPGYIAMITGVVTIAGAIYSALAPPPTQPFSGDVPTSQQSKALMGVRNQLRPYDVIPSILGKHKLFPPYLAKPYTEIVGNDQYLRLLFTFGYGPLQISDLKIGETNFSDYGLIEGTDYNILDGFSDDVALSLFTEDIHEQGLGFEVTDLNSDDTLGGEESRGISTTQGNTVEGSVDIVFPAGLIAFKDFDGRPIEVQTYFLIEFREFETSGSWIPIVPTNELADGVSLTTVEAPDPSGLDANIVIEEKQRGMVIRGLRWSFPSAGKYDVRVRRTATTLNGSTSRNNVSGVKHTNRVYDSTWTKLRSIRPYIGTSVPNLCKLEMRIKASDRLSGMLDTVNGVGQNWIAQWSSVKGWGSRTILQSDKDVSLFLTRNPAWQFAHVLRGHQNHRPVNDEQIDHVAIASWASDCSDGTGTLGGELLARTFDAVVDFPLTVRKLLDDIAGSARASFNIVDSMYSIVVDKEKTHIIQHFTPRNSNSFTGSKVFRRKPHAMKVNFISPSIGYKPEEIIVYNDGFSETGNKSVYLGFRGSLTPTNLVTGGAGAGVTWGVNTASTYSSGGVLKIVIEGVDHRIYTPGGSSNWLGIEASTSNPQKFVRMKVRRTAEGDASWEGSIYFQTGNLSFSGSKRHHTPEPEWNEGWVTLVWDMTNPDNGDWLGSTVDRLRFDLFTGGSSFGTTYEIESIQIDDGTLEATEFSSMDLWGQTDANQAWRDGRYHMASYQLRPETYTIETDAESMVCNRGDKVRVTHDVMAVGYGAARLTSISLDGSGDFIGGTLDETFVYKSDKAYQVHIRKRDGIELSVQLSTLSDESNQIAVAKDNSGSDIAVAVPGMDLAIDDLVLFGESEKNSGEYIVHAITPKQDLAASLTLVDYNDAVYSTDQIPEFVSNTSTQQLPEIQEPPTPSITTVISDETVMTFTGGMPTPRILVRCSVPSINAERLASGIEVPATHIVVETQEVSLAGSPISGWLSSPASEIIGSHTESSFYGLDVGGHFNIRARSVSSVHNTSSDWASWGQNPHVFIGGSAPPPDVTNIRVTRDYMLQWSYANFPNDLKGFIVKYQGGEDSTWDTGAKAHDGFVSTTNFRLQGIIPYGEQTVMVKAVDWFNNESLNAVSIQVNIVPDSRENVIRYYDHQARYGYPSGTLVGDHWHGGFNGDYVQQTSSFVSITNGAVVGTDIIADDAGAIFWINPNRSFWGSDSTDDFWVDTYLDLVVEFESITHVAEDDPCRVMLDISTIGDSYSVEFAQEDTEYINPGYPPLQFQGVFASGYAVWPGELTITQDPPIISGSIGSAPASIIRWRVTIVGGRLRPRLTAAKTYVDAPIIEELFSDQSITNASLGLRLVPTMPFKKVTSVMVNLRENPSGSYAQYTVVSDIDEYNAGNVTGPLVKAYNWGLVNYEANFDAIIRGY